MKNEVLKDITEYATQKLKASYGYCGVAKGETMVMINSDDGEGNDIKISIEIKPEKQICKVAE